MDAHTLIPDAFLLTAKRLPSGTVVLVQDADNGQQTIIIPPQFVAAVCQGIYDVSIERVGP